MDDIQTESKRYGGSGGRGDFFQFEKGENRLRILAQPKVIALHFSASGVKPEVCIGIDEGCPHHVPDEKTKEVKKPSIKLATYILDRKDDKVKLAELPLSISYALNDLQKDSEYAFEGFPMPYDVKIISDPENPDPKAKYRLVAGRAQTDLTKEQMDELQAAMDKMTPEQYVERRKEKQKGNAEFEGKPEAEKKIEYPTDDINPEDIPF